jgi:peptidyl-prolyl cis-trans isomerase SurA
MNEAKIKKDERFTVAKKRLVENIKKTSGYRLNRQVFDKYVTTLNDDFLSFKWAPELSAMAVAEPLMNFGGNTDYSVSDFALFCKKNTKSRLKYEKSFTTIKEVAEILLNEFSEEKAIDFEQKLLEVKYPDFKALLREYDEGILLFEATKRAVWDKANQDSVGLQSFYQGHQNDYKTDEKGNLLVYNISTTDAKLAEKIMKMAKAKSPEDVLKKFNKKEQIVTFVEETLEKSSPRFKDLVWQTKQPTPLTKNAENGAYVFSLITKIFPVRPKTLKEARGYVVADYQEYLEAEWLKDLSKMYTVKINQEVLDKLTRN